MSTIDLTDGEFAGAAAAVRRTLDEDEFAAALTTAIGTGVVPVRPCATVELKLTPS